jgi:prepilin-type processing-associated H-X9-DG protein
VKPRFSHQRNHALTRTEVLVVIAVIICFAVFLFTGLVDSKAKTQRINCMSNLKQIGVAFRLWEGDGAKYPMAVSVTNGGAMELIAPGKAYVLWQTLSNQLSFPKILWCPADAKTSPATNFSTGFGDANISYFVSMDAAENYPQMILSGDDNLLVDDQPVQPGILNLRTNQAIAWSKDRHHGVGNVGMADGSVQMVISEGFQQAHSQGPRPTSAGSATNRWLVP